VITVAEIHAAIVRVAGKVRDPEMAHQLEDRLYQDVLAAIALGADNAKELAEAALKCSEIRFRRWYA
jgi:hypothetical protein